MIKQPKGFYLEVLLMGAIAISILLRILNLGGREFWYDEVLSLIISNGQKITYQTPKTPVTLAEYSALLQLPVELSFGDSIETIKNFFKGIVGGEPHPPLFYLSQHLWLRLFGNSEAAMRSNGAILSVGAIAGAYGLGRVVSGHRSGLLLAALLATNPFYLFHSLNIRMYGPLVLWAILSAWALLELIESPKSEDTSEPKRGVLQPFWWNLLLMGSVAAGLLTFYLFAYWVVTLAVLVLFLDRGRWWQHGLRLGAGVLLTIPWVIWGTRQQLRNADIERFSTSQTAVESGLRHLQDVAQTLGTHLLLGDWVTSLPPASVIIAGIVTIALLTACGMILWKQSRRLLGIVLILGIFPLLLALTVDIVTGKFTLGFGWGRTTIFILPGCLLLMVIWLERAAGKWRGVIASTLLLLYLSISIGDFSLRQRWMFHQIANLIKQEPTTPTLVAMNSNAWGHVLRLAYYIPPTAPVTLLAQPPVELGDALQKALTANRSEPYARIIWLDSENPVWSRLKTEVERETEKQKIQNVLKTQFQMTKTQQLLGTMDMDNFTVNLYKRSVVK